MPVRYGILTVALIDSNPLDVSLGVDVDAVAGVGVHGQGVNLGVSLGVGLIVGTPPLTSLDS